MSAAVKMIVKVLILFHVLAGSVSAATDDPDLIPVSEAKIGVVGQVPSPESSSLAGSRVEGAGMLSFLVAGFAWPLLGGVLMLAAANSRKPRPDRKRRAWPW